MSPAMLNILSLQPRRMWHWFLAQDGAFLAMTAYLFFEYVRPQQIYKSFAIIPFGQITIALSILIFLGKGRWFSVRSGANALLLAYCAVVLASSFAAYDTSASIDKWQLFFSWVVIYFLIINVVRTEEKLAFYLFTWLIWNFYMSQGATRQFAGRGFSFASWGVKGAPGWFQNSGEFGIEMCIFLPIAWHFYLAARPHLDKWRKAFLIAMPVTAVLGIIGSSSRGSLLGMGSVAAWALLRSKSRFRAGIGVAMLVGAVYLVLPQQQRERFSESGEDSTSTRRLTYWQRGMEMAAARPVLGVGYANWIRYYTDHYVDRTQEINYSFGFVQLPHNIFVECVAELGYVGLSVFVSLILATFVLNYRSRKLARAGPEPSDFIVQVAYGLDGALVGLLASGFFVTVLYYPFFWINLSFTAALNNVARRHGARQRALASAGAGSSGAMPMAATVAAGSSRNRRSLRRRR